MRLVNSTVRKTVIAVSAVAALAGGGIAAPQVFAAASDDGTPLGHSVSALNHRHSSHAESADDHGRHLGLDSARDHAERKTLSGRHVEPRDDHGGKAEPGDDRGGSGRSSGHESSSHGGSDDRSGHGGSDD